ncbi:MAG: acyl--CoA ligase [Prevotella sp.]|nr:acyl--CoA ligase [Prevotella sp.]
MNEVNNLCNGVFQQIERKPESVALQYFGFPVTYQRLGKMIMEVASGLRRLGINNGDVISVSLPSTPESIALVYALNMIGAVTCFVDVRFTAQQVSSIVNNTHSKALFIMSFNLKSIAKVVLEIDAKYIIVMRGSEIFPKQVAFWYDFADIFNGRKIAFRSDRRFIRWADVLGRTDGSVDIYNWNKMDPQLIFQTSGTTGISKSVLITAENVEKSREATLLLMNDIKPEDTVLNLIPIFAFYGFLTSIHLPLSYGMRVVIIPIWKPRNFIKLIGKSEPQHIFVVPSSWDVIYKSTLKNYSLDFLKTIVVAGDVVNPTYEMKINDYLKNHGCKYHLTKVYGMTETAGVVAATPQESVHKYEMGYSGRVMVDCQIKIIKGEICICPSIKFHGYFNNRQATEQLIREHDGKKWIHTGDIGRLTEDGELFVVGRYKRMIVRHDGTKVFPVEIESALLQCPNVRACLAVGISDPLHPQSHVPSVYVVLNENGFWRKKSVVRYCKEKLPVYLQPEKIVFVKELPTNSNGKVDYLKL